MQAENRVAVVGLSRRRVASLCRILCKYLHPYRYISIFKKFSMAIVRHLECVGGSRVNTDERPFIASIPCKYFVMFGLVVQKL